MVFNPKPSYTYSDIGLKPLNLSTQESRDNVNTRIKFFGYDLSLPMILAPMETVVGEQMSKVMGLVDGFYVIPRTGNETSFGNRGIFSVGLRNWDGENPVCIDVANGFHELVGNMIKKIKSSHPDTLIMAGNVASVEGFKYLAECGADAIRVGIGGGSVCTTSIATGIGIGQASIVREIADWANNNQPYNVEKMPLIIADGGIKTPGDVVKAIALGADIVMVGGIFAGTDQAPGEIIEVEGKLYKRLAGQASFHVKGENKYVEGASKLVPHKGSAVHLWQTFQEGLKSGMAYLNCNTLDELRYLPDEYFVLLSNSAKFERGVHA